MAVDPLLGMTIDFAPQATPPPDAPRGGLGSQVLPVADLGDDFEGQPEDGLEYLFLVRSVSDLLPAAACALGVLWAPVRTQRADLKVLRT